MRLHDWSEPDAERVRTCRRPGCGVQTKPSLGLMRAVAWRPGPNVPWSLGVLECVAEEASYGHAWGAREGGGKVRACMRPGCYIRIADHSPELRAWQRKKGGLWRLEIHEPVPTCAGQEFAPGPATS